MAYKGYVPQDSVTGRIPTVFNTANLLPITLTSDTGGVLTVDGDATGGGYVVVSDTATIDTIAYTTGTPADGDVLFIQFTAERQVAHNVDNVTTYIGTSQLVAIDSVVPFTYNATESKWKCGYPIPVDADGWIPEGFIPYLPPAKIPQEIPRIQAEASVDAKTTGVTNLGLAAGSFIPTRLIIRCTAATAITVPCSIAVGFNSPNYDNILAGTVLSAMLANGDIMVFSITNTDAFDLDSGADLNINVTAAATGTSQTLGVRVEGYYI